MLCGLKGASRLASGGVNQGLRKPLSDARLTARVSSDTFRILEKIFQISTLKSGLAKDFKTENKQNEKAKKMAKKSWVKGKKSVIKLLPNQTINRPS